MFKYAEYIYKIYEEGSFTGAAKKLYISQPALSATVKKAEEELGFTIFDRATTPLSLTTAGTEYIAAIEQMAKIERNLKNKVENIYALLVGDIAVGGAAFISSFILPEIIMEFSSRHPKIEIGLTEASSELLKEELRSEKIDVLIDYDFDVELFDAILLKTEQILLAVPKDNKINDTLMGCGLTVNDIKEGKHLSNPKRIGLKGFESERFIRLKEGNSMHNYSRAICGEYGFAADNVIYVDQLLTAYNMAASGMGITFTTDTVVASTTDSGNLVFYVPESRSARRGLYIASKLKRHKSPAVEEFLKIAKEIYV